LIQQLADPAAEVRYAAIGGLVEADRFAAAALVAALDGVRDPSHQAWLHVALAELYPASLQPLLAGLEAESAAVRAQSAKVLGRVSPAHLATRLLAPALVDGDLEVRQAATGSLVRILGDVPTLSQAEQLLREAIEHHLEARLPLATNESGEVDVWYWDRASQMPVATKLTARAAHVFIASRLSSDLVNIAPTNKDYLEQNTMLQLAAGATDPWQSGAFAGLDAEQMREVTLAALDEALRRDFPRAAIGATRALARMPAGEAILLSHAPSESPLVRSLAHPSKAVRWEALSAIMQLAPESPFPGASRVAHSVAEFAQAGTRPRAVVAMRTLERAQNVAAEVVQLGYEVELATTGREAVQAAARSGGAELVLLDARISQPDMRETLYQIRANPSSSQAAIGVVGIGVGLARARSAADDHRGVEAFPHPLVVREAAQPDDTTTDAVETPETSEDPRSHVVVDGEAVAAIIERATRESQPLELEGLPSRQEMAHRALGWLGELLARPGAFYEVRKYEPVVLQAADNPALAGAAVEILARLGSHESQLRLVNIASTLALPIALRESAASAFRLSVSQSGVQLTTGEILQQYDRYNASETADRATQQVLGHVLDTLEARRMQTAGE
jgi:CheY-like chemotaxis protein